MKHFIEISREGIDHVIVDDLKNEYNAANNNQELMLAIKVVLQHYMSPTEYIEWFNNGNTNK
jgi:predicted RNase H-like HicB family nuclease